LDVADAHGSVPGIDVGAMFGAYKIQGKLGEGGMGVVYRAVDTHLQRQVAIKTLLGAADADGAARFLREAKAASRLQHPSVVTIYHIGVESGVPYIVMELVEGNTLKKVIGGRAMALRHACDVAMQVCEGLAAAHEMGVIHRDIKAENVIITPRGAVKILDFGLAKLAEAPTNDGVTVAHTQAGVVLGTLSHMSPEQALGREVDTRTDIFSFGVVLYEMLTGRTPFAAQTAQAILAKVLNHAPEPVTQSNPAVSPELEQVVVDCLQKDRELRPSAVEVLSMLRGVRDALSSRPPGAGAATSPAVAFPASRSGPHAVSSQGSAAAAPSLRPSMPAVAGTSPAPHSGRAAAASPDAQPGAASGLTFEMQATHWATRALRLVVAVLTATVPLAFLLHFFIGGGVIRPEIVEGTFVRRYMDAIVAPVLEVAGKVLTFRTVVDGWNLLLPVMVVVTLVLRRVVQLPFIRAERWAKGRVAGATRTESRGAAITAAPKVADQRMAMLREYAETKKLLFQQKRRLAFLAADVPNSPRLKAGEDKLVIEHAFAEYRKYVERVLSSNNVWKLTWQGESVIAAFFTADAAVRAAQQVIDEIAWFNDGVHQLRYRFEVRAAVSVGDVVFPEDRKIEDVTDEALGLAVQLRDRAPSGSAWVSAEALADVADGTGFRSLDTVVSGQEVREWRPTAGAHVKVIAADDSTTTAVQELTVGPGTTGDDGEITIGPAPRPVR
jgi:serine/threonine protein kinase